LHNKCINDYWISLRILLLKVRIPLCSLLAENARFVGSSAVSCRQLSIAKSLIAKLLTKSSTSKRFENFQRNLRSFEIIAVLVVVRLAAHPVHVATGCRREAWMAQTVVSTTCRSITLLKWSEPLVTGRGGVGMWSRRSVEFGCPMRVSTVAAATKFCWRAAVTTTKLRLQDYSSRHRSDYVVYFCIGSWVYGRLPSRRCPLSGCRRVEVAPAW